MMREDWVEIRFDGLISNVSTSNNKVKQREYLQKGLYPVIDQGQELIGGYIDDEEKIVECNLPVIVFGDHTKIVKYINFKFAPGADGTKILEPKRMVEPKYLYYVTKFVAKKIEDRGYARHYQYLRKESVFVAPAPEQRAIVAKIEELFSELDSGIESLKKAKKQLETYRQAVLKSAFEGKLTNTRLVDKKISEISLLVTKGSSPKWQGFDYIEDQNELIFITSENVREGYLSFEKAKYLSLDFNKIQNRSILKKNDILFNIVGASIGRAAIFNLDKIANINQAVAIIRLNNEVSPKYLNYFLNSEISKQVYLQKQVDVARANLSLQNVNDIEFPFCELEEQLQIIAEIETRLSVCDNILATIEGALEKAGALRQSILKKAFEGKLLSNKKLEDCARKSDWEPSTDLLKRIKQDKKGAKSNGK